MNGGEGGHKHLVHDSKGVLVTWIYTVEKWPRTLTVSSGALNPSSDCSSTRLSQPQRHWLSVPAPGRDYAA